MGSSLHNNCVQEIIACLVLLTVTWKMQTCGLQPFEVLSPPISPTPWWIFTYTCKHLTYGQISMDWLWKWCLDIAIYSVKPGVPFAILTDQKVDYEKFIKWLNQTCVRGSSKSHVAGTSVVVGKATPPWPSTSLLSWPDQHSPTLDHCPCPVAAAVILPWSVLVPWLLFRPMLVLLLINTCQWYLDVMGP